MRLNGRCYFRLNGRVGSGPQITQFLPLLSLYSGGKCLRTSKQIYKKRKFHLGTSAIKGNKQEVKTVIVQVLLFTEEMIFELKPKR